MAKVNENVFKGDLEKDQTNWTTNICTTLENNAEEEPGEYTGFAVILGPWIVHMFEAEGPLMQQYIHKLNEKKNTKVNDRGSYFHNVWVLQFTEDIPQRAYFSWSCKMVPTSNATREVKSMGDFEKTCVIYDSLSNIGAQAASV